MGIGKMNEPQTKKSLGQHWLHDEDSLQAMCNAADVGLNDTILEVGPGLGTLTTLLVARAQRVVAVEFDNVLAAQLPKRVPAKNLEVVHQDILSFNFSDLPEGYKLVANIPYYLTSNLLRRVCESPPHFSKAVLLVQKEVAERVCARPGSMSLLSVSVQFYCDVALCELVPAELFTPPPKVDSQILQLTFRTKPLFVEVEPKQFFRLVKAGFSERRKTLLNSLSGGLALGKDEVREILNGAGIDPGLRAQALSLENWHSLYSTFIAIKR